MAHWYALLKVVHVVSAVVWIGGNTALVVVMARLLRARDRGTLAGLVPQASKYGHSFGAPSSMLVLLTGIAMVAIGRIGFGTFWVLWGFGGIVLHFIFGALVMSRRSMAFAAAASATPVDDAQLVSAGGALRRAGFLYLLLMVSVIVAMVVKPTL
jgi:uncharacterized membrane protein